MLSQTSKCRLCGTGSSPLRNSHIVPEFLYKSLYNERGNMLAIRQPDETHRAGRLLQKGIRERLFCESCEQHFNEHFEKPFLKQWVPTPLPDPWNVNGIYRVDVDYTSFKLFHLSVVFRAAVSSLPHYAEVNLGSHESVLRKRLLEVDPGSWLQYPIAGRAVIHHQTRCIVPIITQPTVYRYESHHYHTMVYGGVEWWIKVSSHRHKQLEELFLRTDGEMPFRSVLWNEVPSIVRASAALQE